MCSLGLWCGGFVLWCSPLPLTGEVFPLSPLRLPRHTCTHRASVITPTQRHQLRQTNRPSCTILIEEKGVIFTLPGKSSSCSSGKRKSKGRVKTQGARCFFFPILNVLNGKKRFNMLHSSLKISYNECKSTQVGHGPSFDRSILTVLLQVDCKRRRHIKNSFKEEMLLYWILLCDNFLITTFIFSVLPILGSITSSMLGTGVGSSMSLVKSSSGSSSGCPRLLLWTHTQINAETAHWMMCQLMSTQDNTLLFI